MGRWENGQGSCALSIDHLKINWNKKTWTFLACLGLRLATAPLKGQKTTKKTTQQSNGGGERVGGVGEWTFIKSQCKLLNIT